MDSLSGGTPPPPGTLQMDVFKDYMNYMEGIAVSLPRCLYVHGSGQEVINFDKME